MSRRLLYPIYASLICFLMSSCNQPNSKDNKINNNEEISDNRAGETPFVKVVDTDFSKGRLGLEHEVTLNDIAIFHGHLCDGLVEGFLGLKEGLMVLYPDGIVDRTNTRIVSKSSPCLTDVAVYLTGGRYQFNSFYISEKIDGMYIVQRIDNLKTVLISRKKGVKPQEIDVLGAKAVKKELGPCELEYLKTFEDDYSKFLLSTNPKDHFTVKIIDDFKWTPELNNRYIKTDIINKNASVCVK